MTARERKATDATGTGKDAATPETTPEVAPTDASGEAAGADAVGSGASPAAAADVPENAERPEDDADTPARNATANGTVYLNVTTSPVVFDKAGHRVEPDCWTDPVHLDAIGQAARRNGYLLPRSAL